MHSSDAALVTDTLATLFDCGLIGHEISTDTPAELRQFYNRDPSDVEIRTAFVVAFVNLVITERKGATGRHRPPHTRSCEDLLRRTILLLDAQQRMRHAATGGPK